jgi:hypothetical protein
MNNSPSENKTIPPSISQQGLTKSFIYNGPSMKPTFQTGQLLYVRPNVQDVQPGDVLVYKQNNGHVVHRVISTNASGYITRGDNNRLKDAAPISPDQVIGRVELAEGEGAIHRIAGGRHGLWSAQRHWAGMHLSLWLRIVFGWPYRLIKKKRLLRGLWHPKVVTICLQTESGVLYKYLYHNKTIGTWNPQSGIFHCRRPFDLILFPPNLDKQN